MAPWTDEPESLACFELLVDAAKDYALITLDPEGRVLTWNSGARRLYGYEAEAIIGQSASRLYPAEDAAKGALASNLVAAEQEGRVEIEGWRVRSDGSIFWAAVVLDTVRAINGTRRVFAVVTHDLSERRACEALAHDVARAKASTTTMEESEQRLREKEEAERRLRYSEERVRLALAAASIGTWDFYPKTGSLFWDERCKQIHGIEIDAEVTYDLFLASIHPDDRQRVDDHVQEMLHPTITTEYALDFRVVGVSKSGQSKSGQGKSSQGKSSAGSLTERWASVTGAVLFDELGRPARFIGITQDITAKVKTDETRKRLLAIVGHDLRGPLSAIRTATGLLARALPTGQPNLVGIISRSVDRMAAMISQLLDFTRVRLGGGIVIERSQVDLIALARQIVEEVGLAHGGRTPILEARGSLVGRFDPARMEQVFANLLHNALIHGGHDRPVIIALRDEGDEVVIEVRNEGPPIPKEMLPQLFNPFLRGGMTPDDPIARRKDEGLGLGLYITHQIVLAHGGRIDVSSTRERGTLFRVYVPRCEPLHESPGGTAGAAPTEESGSARR